MFEHQARKQTQSPVAPSDRGDSTHLDTNPDDKAGDDVPAPVEIDLDLGIEPAAYRYEKSIAGPLPASIAIDLAEDHLSENLERFIRRFERWHVINSQ